MNEKDNIRDELKLLAPKLTSLHGKNEGFSVPKDYFKNLPDELIERIRQDMPDQPEVHWYDKLLNLSSTFIKPRYALALAAVLVLITVGIWFLTNPGATQTAAPLVQIEEISDEALFTYVSDNIRDFDRDLLVSQSVKEGEEVKPLQQITKPSTEEMEQYLDGIIDDLDMDDLQEIL